MDVGWEIVSSKHIKEAILMTPQRYSCPQNLNNGNNMLTQKRWFTQALTLKKNLQATNDPWEMDNQPFSEKIPLFDIPYKVVSHEIIYTNSHCVYLYTYEYICIIVIITEKEAIGFRGIMVKCVKGWREGSKGGDDTITFQLKF